MARSFKNRCLVMGKNSQHNNSNKEVLRSLMPMVLHLPTKSRSWFTWMGVCTLLVRLRMLWIIRNSQCRILFRKCCITSLDISSIYSSWLSPCRSLFQALKSDSCSRMLPRWCLSCRWQWSKKLMMIIRDTKEIKKPTSKSTLWDEITSQSTQTPVILSQVILSM